MVDDGHMIWTYALRLAPAVTGRGCRFAMVMSSVVLIVMFALACVTPRRKSHQHDDDQILATPKLQREASST